MQAALQISSIVDSADKEFAALSNIHQEQLEALRITAESDIPEQVQTILIGNAGFAAPSNISGISAPPKAAKTGFGNACVAGALSNDGFVNDFADIKVVANIKNRAVICIDTEQSEYDQQWNIKGVLKRNNLKSTPNNYFCYNLRKLKFKEYKSVTTRICEYCNRQCDGIHLIFIDGVADYLSSVNDEVEAHEIAQYFIHLAITYNCPVIVIIHQNPGTQKERGHAGSELQRKCYGLVSVEKTGNISTVQPKLLRKASNEDMPLISFKYHKEKGYHVQVDNVDKEAEKDANTRQRHQDVAIRVFKKGISLSYTQGVEAIMQETNKGERTAKSMISNMTGWKQINKGTDGNYRINNS
jgi:hypothetical protein